MEVNQKVRVFGYDNGIVIQGSDFAVEVETHPELADVASAITAAINSAVNDLLQDNPDFAARIKAKHDPAYAKACWGFE